MHLLVAWMCPWNKLRSLGNEVAEWMTCSHSSPLARSSLFPSSTHMHTHSQTVFVALLLAGRPESPGLLACFPLARLCFDPVMPILSFSLVWTGYAPVFNVRHCGGIWRAAMNRSLHRVPSVLFHPPQTEYLLCSGSNGG